MTPTSLCKASSNQLPKCNLIQDSWYTNKETELCLHQQDEQENNMSKTMCHSVVILLVLFGKKKYKVFK